MQLRLASALGLIALVSFSAHAGTLYVDDGLDIYRYSSNGTPSVFSNQPGSTVIGMAFNSSGTLYAAARDSSAIYAYSPGGVRTTFATPSNPVGLAIDALGDIFTTTQFGGGQILEYTPQGASSVFANSANAASMAFDGSGNLYTGSLNGAGTITKYAPNGSSSVFATVSGSAVFGLAFDGAGNLYATDWSGEISKITPGGQVSVFATFSSQMLATGLVYDTATSNLYMIEVANGVSNCCTQQVLQFTPSGAMSTFATGLFNPFGIADLQNTGTPEPAMTLPLLALGVAAFRRVRRF
jgi:sugar lactone lactonase YvrE